MENHFSTLFAQLEKRPPSEELKKQRNERYERFKKKKKEREISRKGRCSRNLGKSEERKKKEKRTIDVEDESDQEEREPRFEPVVPVESQKSTTRANFEKKKRRLFVIESSDEEVEEDIAEKNRRNPLKRVQISNKSQKSRTGPKGKRSQKVGDDAKRKEKQKKSVESTKNREKNPPKRRYKTKKENNTTDASIDPGTISVWNVESIPLANSEYRPPPPQEEDENFFETSQVFGDVDLGEVLELEEQLAQEDHIRAMINPDFVDWIIGDSSAGTPAHYFDSENG